MACFYKFSSFKTTRFFIFYFANPYVHSVKSDQFNDNMTKSSLYHVWCHSQSIGPVSDVYKCEVDSDFFKVPDTLVMPSPLDARGKCVPQGTRVPRGQFNLFRIDHTNNSNSM